LSTDNKRYHCPVCWQRYELDLPATGGAAHAITPTAPIIEKEPAVELTESHKPWRKK